MSTRTLPPTSASGWTAARGTRPPRTWPGTLGPLRAAARRSAALVRRPVRWWHALGALDRVMYRACALLGAGFALTPWPQLGLIVPGVLFALAYFGFRRGA